MKLQKIGLTLVGVLLALVLNTCTDTPVGPAPSTDKAITAFAFANPIAAGIISEADHTINITVPFGTNVAALVPVFTQTGTSISPVLGTAANFSSPVTYTVRAEDNSTQAYVVTVTVAPGATSKAISAFGFTSPGAVGIIDQTTHTIAITVPYGTTVAGMAPVIGHSGASISPASGLVQNFSSPATYTVTAVDGSTQPYVVTVSVAPEPTASLDLSSLTVSSGTLTPVFNPSTTSYTLSVGNAVSGLSVGATKADVSTTIGYSPSQYPTLAIGTNTVVVTVTGPNGASKAYTIVVTRAAPLDYASPNIGTLKYVPAGTFQRDATATNLSTVSAFRMAATEVTRAQFVAVTGLADPSDLNYSLTVNDPVQNVNWYHALVFCNRLSALEGLTPVYTISNSVNPTAWGAVPTTANATWNAATVNASANGYRLPTEMEWMWAAMGATSGATGYAKAFAGSTGSNLLSDYAWFSGNDGNTTHPVGTKLPNELGLYDMSGNVWEWNWDWFGSYPTGSASNYQGAASGTSRVLRGGSWAYSASYFAVAFRYFYSPYGQLYFFGFRVVRP